MMPSIPDQDPSTNPALERRFSKTLSFLKEVAPPPGELIDLGPPNPLAERMKAAGYRVANTRGDLDERPEAASGDADVVTAFEILEHLVSPLPLLRGIRAPRLVATVPLRLWFAAAYRNPSDPWDRHFHEFEDWQFDWLLEKAGWSIVRTEKWTSPTGIIGVRPLLRRFTPRYYAVFAERSS
jgi:hypothetical protein